MPQTLQDIVQTGQHFKSSFVFTLGFGSLMHICFCCVS